MRFWQSGVSVGSANSNFSVIIWWMWQVNSGRLGVSGSVLLQLTADLSWIRKIRQIGIYYTNRYPVPPPFSPWLLSITRSLCGLEIQHHHWSRGLMVSGAGFQIRSIQTFLYYSEDRIQSIGYKSMILWHFFHGLESHITWCSNPMGVFHEVWSKHLWLSIQSSRETCISQSVSTLSLDIFNKNGPTFIVQKLWNHHSQRNWIVQAVFIQLQTSIPWLAVGRRLGLHWWVIKMRIAAMVATQGCNRAV